MAIERQGELPKAQTPTEEEFIEQVTISQPEEEVGFVMMEDGSAIPESELDVPQEVSFYDNLADVMEEDELSKISNDLMAGVEKDKSSRSDWEKTYTDGLKYLGMRFDEE